MRLLLNFKKLSYFGVVTSIHAMFTIYESCLSYNSLKIRVAVFIILDIQPIEKKIGIFLNLEIPQFKIRVAAFFDIYEKSDRKLSDSLFQDFKFLWQQKYFRFGPSIVSLASRFNLILQIYILDVYVRKILQNHKLPKINHWHKM